ncbi:MAG: formate-dependent phosphoribosylglycinamide formyltransferase [Prochlorococcus sp. SP3034]|nr:formate-dependent phosphoribosylglycinamide formyltransferase [Prochlorococcus sp. SP3034]|tara:strand:+ start:1452 stop:2633 length:1182 start_codon:yes stop_codon:yes gene_type:complete
MNIDRSYSKKLLVLGSGELGKEFVIESQRLGCEIMAVDKYPNAPAMQVADDFRVIDMNDGGLLKEIINKFNPDYVIPEIEALSIEALKDLENEGVKIVPNARTVEITMNRNKIRDLASESLGIRTAKYRYVYNISDLTKKASEIGFPLLVKPFMSSSGKGQNVVIKEEDLFIAWNDALTNSRGNVSGVILEEFIKFNYEFTLLSVRTKNKKNIFCLPIGHEQLNGDYQCSWQPLDIKHSLLEESKQITAKILDNLDGAGIYGVEFFVKGDEIIFSELSPRPHDTGMVTLFSQNINEFELHLRAILDLPIPKINILRPSATRVILSNGDYSNFTFEGLDKSLKVENSKIFIFGKPIAKKGRRMGVAIASGENSTIARKKADICAANIKILPIEQ